MAEPPERFELELMTRQAEAKVAERWRLFGADCDERRRRLWAASEAKVHGPGGAQLVARAIGISEDTIRRGIAELESEQRLEVRRSGVRAGGVGRSSMPIRRWLRIWSV